MARKKYDPAIAARIKQDTYDYLVDVAKRRRETITDVVKIAIYEYEEKLRKIDNDWSDLSVVGCKLIERDIS